MTEFSWNWSCEPSAGDAGPLDVENLMSARMFLNNPSVDESGVIYWTNSTNANVFLPALPASPVDNLLEPSLPGGGIVKVESGVALVQGWLYINTDEVDFDIDADPGEANATDIIVLRRDDPAVTPQVRLARKKATAPSTTATVTQNATTWEVKIADVTLDGSGNLSTMTDQRKLVPSTGHMVKIAETELTSSTATITFDNIPPLFRHLVVEGTVAIDDLSLRFNNDAGGNYEYQRTDATAAAVTTAAFTAASSIQFFAIGGPSAQYETHFTIDVPDYLNTNFDKSALAKLGVRDPGTSRAAFYTTGWWDDTTAIERIDLFGSSNFSAGSRITLYGVI